MNSASNRPIQEINPIQLPSRCKGSSTYTVMQRCVVYGNSKLVQHASKATIPTRQTYETCESHVAAAVDAPVQRVDVVNIFHVNRHTRYSSFVKAHEQRRESDCHRSPVVNRTDSVSSAAYLPGPTRFVAIALSP